MALNPDTHRSVSVVMPRQLVDAIDGVAGHGKRSEWIAEAARMRLEGPHARSKPTKRPPARDASRRSDVTPIPKSGR